MKMRLLPALLALAAVAACESTPSAPSFDGAVMIARESLATIDGQALPCCAQAGANVIAGSLDFYRGGSYPDTAYTPGGAMPSACVQGVPNGAHIHGNTVVSLPDGTSYILIGCSTGLYQVSLKYPGIERGPAVVSMGTYQAGRDMLALADASRPVGASVAGLTMTVRAAGHVYTFVPFSGP